MTDQNRFRRISIILLVLALIALAVHMEALVRFNQAEKMIHGNDDRGEVRMEIDSRKDSTSTWLKRSFKLDNGGEADLIGQTIDGTLYNGSGDQIRDWDIRVNILGDCYINQAWNGEVEIHQFVGTEKETVQRMNLQNYNLEEVTFQYRYDGDLLIPLQAGDFIIYFPSERFSEMPISGGEDVKIGMIFYYLEELDLSDYDLRMHFHRDFTQGITFYPVLVLSILWLLSIGMNVVMTVTYRRARKEMELRKSGIFSMSDIYDVIYIIHLPTGEMTPVSVDQQLERKRPKNRTAKELMTEMVLNDAEDKYRETMLEFVDTDTLAERLKDRDSVVSEFPSKQYGWCAIRFYAMDRAEGKPLENVVFTVQNINEEKKEQEAVSAQINKAESDIRSQSAFLDHIAGDIRKPLQELLGRIDLIAKESRDEAVRGYAMDAHSITVRMLTLAEGLTDSTQIQSGSLQAGAEGYSLKELLNSVIRDTLPLAEQNHTAVTLDIADHLPDGLRGDARILKEIIENLIAGLLPAAAGRTMQLALYGKTVEEKSHLLFSVRAFSEQQSTALSDLPEEDRGTGTGLSGLNLDIAATLLTGLGSELRHVQNPAGRQEYYFEVEQQIVHPEPIGTISIEKETDRALP